VDLTSVRLRLVLMATAVLCAGLTAPAQTPGGSAATLPPAATHTIDFTREIKPILQVSCVRCHARGRTRGGFSIESREALLKGGDNGPAVVPGDSGASDLIALVAGLDPEMVMPKKGSRLTREQVGLLRAWIDQGLPWDPAVSFAKAPPRNLTPRRPELPSADQASANPVDRLLASYFAGHESQPGRAADDRQFARRVYLDAIGLLPSPQAVSAFVADARPGKRQRLVARLLANDRQYAAHWLSFWNDLLRNDYRGTGYIDGGREQISAWLYAALANNLPYDRFVASLVNPTRATEGFTKGIVWRGVVNASQTPQMQAAQNISQVFMGVNLKCASCHDSFINDWQLADAYGMAGIYAESPLEMVECDRPTGKTAPMKLLYGELGTIDAQAPRSVRLQRFSHALVSAENGRLARTIVNRLWGRFMGRALVEPVDDMEQPAWNQDLLDWLASDLADHGYDLKRTIGLILGSEAYGREAVDLDEQADPYVFRGPAIRRLSAEQFVDALSAVTGIWQKKVAGEFDFTLVSSHAAPVAGRTRAALVTADPLMSALGRPNREQVVTVRASAATTLQSLELSNGSALASHLQRGAARLIARPEATDSLVRTIFQRALSRPPTGPELEVCRGVLGKAPTAAGVEDLLWSIVMLPEFQLIH
jgi:hypothetical protein